ncbi:MAG: orotidine-5'-phosphate decarboxylase [Flammeovirgaceae bacterium]
MCVGLDTDLSKIPSFLRKESDPIFAFNRSIIDATIDYAVAYKPNLAFYEALGAKGWESLQKTLEYIPKNIFTIADAKRGDIGNTSTLYAKAFFEQMNFDAITVAPYMGEDSVKPFLAFTDKWLIILGLTSNTGSSDFQQQTLNNGKMLFEEVIEKSQNWGTDEQIMYVVGATKAESFEKIRKIAPHHFLLVPGIGAQGGDLAYVAQYGMNKTCGLLVNASRSILYASSGENFAKDAAQEAQKIQQEMDKLIDKYLK